MRIRFSRDFYKELQVINKNNKPLINKIQKKLKLIIFNPYHPSLRLHKLKGKLDNIWSISINKDLRIVFIKEENEAYFIDIGTHNQVYKK